MSINFRGRFSRQQREEEPIDVYEADAERLYESFNDLYEDFDEGRSKTPFVIIGALLAIAIVGGGLAFAYKRGMTDGTDGVAVIRADRTATKVEPNDPGGLDIPHQDRQIYEQVAGEGEAGIDGGGAPTALVEGGGADIPEPVMPEAFDPSAPDGEADTGQVEGPGNFTIGDLASRVAAGQTGSIVAQPQAGPDFTAAPGLSGVPAPADPVASSQDQFDVGGSSQEQLAVGGSSRLQPRQVRTVLIGPDGSIIESDGGGEAVPRQIAPGVATDGDPGAGEAGFAPDAAPQNVSGGLGLDEFALNAPAEVEGGQTSLFVPSPRPKPRPTARAPVAAPAPVPTRAPDGSAPMFIPAPNRQVASAPAAAPIAAPAPARAPAVAAAGNFAVQVGSHRQQAEAVANFADLQQRFPSLITGYQPLIQRADLGNRGVFYRLRIGPMTTKTEADRICASLKSAGLPACIISAL